MHTRVENLGTGTKGIPRTLIKGESTEVELSDGGWLMNLVKLNAYSLPSRRARWRYFFDRRGHSSSIVNEDSNLTPRGALSLFFHPQSQTI
jgi:hypothetical protein